MPFIGSKPKRWGMRLATSSTIRSRHEIEVRLPIGLAEIGQLPRIDRMRRGDDLALGCLPEHLGQSDHGHRVRADDVSQHLAGPDRGELVDIADNQQRRGAGYSLQERLHQQHIDHRAFVHDQKVAVEWVLLAAFETEGLRVEF